MSNIILLSLLSLGLITSLSFIYTVKGELIFSDDHKIEGSENLTTVTRQVEEFNSIEVYDQLKVVLKQGPRNIEVTAEDNLIEYVSVMNEDGNLVLSIEAPNERLNWNTPIIVNVTNPSLISIEARQQSEIQINNGFEQDNLVINLRDQSNINGQLTVESLTLKLTQQSGANIRGASGKFELELSDQSSIRAANFVVNDAKINMSQQTNARLNVVNSIKGELSQNAQLSYKGKPAKSNLRTSHQAKVNQGWD